MKNFEVTYREAKPVEANAEYLLTAAQLLPAAVSVAPDPSCKTVIHNPVAADFLRVDIWEGFSYSAPGKPGVRLFHMGKEMTPDDMPLQRSAKLGEGVSNFEITFIWDDGVEKISVWNTCPLWGADGNISGAVGTFIDVTAPAKQAYRKHEERERAVKELSNVINSSNDGIISGRTNGMIQTWNKGAEMIFGYSEKEVIGRNISVLFPFEHYCKAQTILDTVDIGDKVNNFEVVCCHKNGREINISLSAAPIIDNTGSTTGFTIITRDITEKKHAEEQILFQAALLQQVRSAVIAADLEDRITYWNNYAEKLFGWKAEEVLGKDIKKVHFCHHDAGKVYHIRSSVFQEGHWEGELEIRHKDGGTVPVYRVVAAIKNTRGNTVGFVSVSTDISEKKQVEKQMAYYDRLNLVGEMAAGIAHEVRNPMTSVRGFLQILEGKEDNVNYREHYQIMIEELDRANSIITEFLSLARNKSIEVSRRNLNNVILGLLPLLRADAALDDKSINIILGDIPELLLDEKEIRQLILNLAKNGLEAMDRGGRITLKTYQEGKAVVFEVKDTGSGIPEEIMGKIGTPFFTTKENGTGLGLAVCYSIVGRHNAEIEIDTEKNGTSFIVRFQT